MSSVIWVARHGNRQDFVDPNWFDTAERPYDPGLSPDGIEQVRQLGERLTDISVSRIISSPFLRAVQTAHHAAEALDQSIYLEPGLGEWLNPDWFEAMPDIRDNDTLVQQFDRVDLSHEPCLMPSFPETRDEAFERVGRTAACLAERYADDTLLLVGHGITVFGVLAGLVGEDVDDADCPLASLTRIERRNGAWTIAARNDVAHLEGGRQGANRLN